MELLHSLKSLWHTVFEDDFETINAFFNAFPMKDLAATEFVDGQLAAAAYVLPFGEYVAGGKRTPCAHIYAVAVHPDYRGRGLGVSVTNKAAALAESLGYNCVVLHPAERSLFDFYEKHCGFKTCFSASNRELSITEPSEQKALPVSAEEYRAVRERFLADIPHIDISEKVLKLFQAFGGRLYAFPDGCCAAEETPGTTFFREIIGGDEFLKLPPAAQMTDNRRAVLLSPCEFGGESFGMVKGTSAFPNSWMGICLE